MLPFLILQPLCWSIIYLCCLWFCFCLLSCGHITAAKYTVDAPCAATFFIAAGFSAAVQGAAALNEANFNPSSTTIFELKVKAHRQASLLRSSTWAIMLSLEFNLMLTYFFNQRNRLPRPDCKCIFSRVSLLFGPRFGACQPQSSFQVAFTSCRTH